jgi:hypothetical protein
MDDFLSLADSYTLAPIVRAHVDALLNRLGLLCNPQKGILTPTQVGDPLELTIDLHNGEYRASTENYAHSPGLLPPYLAVRPRALDGYRLWGWPPSLGKHISSTLPSPPPASSYASFTTFGYTHMF